MISNFHALICKNLGKNDAIYFVKIGKKKKEKEKEYLHKIT